jgi:hypothetical protein
MWEVHLSQRFLDCDLPQRTDPSRYIVIGIGNGLAGKAGEPLRAGYPLEERVSIEPHPHKGASNSSVISSSVNSLTISAMAPT